jgi:hypothetical protein
LKRIWLTRFNVLTLNASTLHLLPDNVFVIPAIDQSVDSSFIVADDDAVEKFL